MSYFSTVFNSYNVNMGRLEIIPAWKLCEKADYNNYIIKHLDARPVEIKEDIEKILSWRKKHEEEWVYEEYEKLIERECFSRSVYNFIVMPIYLASENGCNSKLFFIDFDFDSKYSKEDDPFEGNIEERNKMNNALNSFYEIIVFFQKKYNAIKKDRTFKNHEAIFEECENKIYIFSGYSDTESWQEMLFVFKELIFNGYTIERVPAIYNQEHDVVYYGNLAEDNWLFEEEKNGVRENRDNWFFDGSRICYRISWDKNARDIRLITGW